MRGKFSLRRQIDAPLLTEQEIAELLAAPPGVSGPARRPSRTGRPGERISPRQGSGTDFAEPRAYQPGDDPRRLDWRATARSGTPLVRTYHAEFSRPLCLVIDRRASMRFGTRTRLKITQAVRVALWLAGRESRTGGELAAVLLDAPCQWLPPARGGRALMRLVDNAVAPCPPRPSPAGTGFLPVCEGACRPVPSLSSSLTLPVCRQGTRWRCALLVGSSIAGRSVSPTRSSARHYHRYRSACFGMTTL